jgi:hypothetical protein
VRRAGEPLPPRPLHCVRPGRARTRRFRLLSPLRAHTKKRHTKTIHYGKR